jgi:CRISPR/Cas system CSM-associated protein Csm3 (group 7 of RAMP superfamily)|mmetsp:Transcript_22408/g.38147  ORF Transcript_22408/g.38147 Transcript_22408/m.38147 type:complete len:91 (-) Transcript_22408:595-867(-)
MASLSRIFGHTVTMKAMTRDTKRNPPKMQLAGMDSKTTPWDTWFHVQRIRPRINTLSAKKNEKEQQPVLPGSSFCFDIVHNCTFNEDHQR